jgi:hypothetical protein
MKRQKEAKGYGSKAEGKRRKSVAFTPFLQYPATPNRREDYEETYDCSSIRALHCR